jgi:hypothetical protein
MGGGTPAAQPMPVPPGRLTARMAPCTATSRNGLAMGHQVVAVQSSLNAYG